MKTEENKNKMPNLNLKHQLLRLICCASFLISVFSQAKAAEKPQENNASSASVSSKNIFSPFLKDKPPEIVEIVSKEVKDGVEVTKLKFHSRTIPGTDDKVIIYGILARPVEKGKYPALLVCHGGGGKAITDWTVGWAKKGYVALSVDEPGICNFAKANSSGPWKKYGWKCFAIDGDATRNALYDGVVANLNALALLRSRADVDKDRVGVIGVSWGGYMTTIISGIAGDRVNASFCIYGCGFYDIGSTWKAMFKRMKKEEVEIWLANLDAGRWASGIKSNFFSCAAANDWFFWLPAVVKTYDEIKSPKNIAISPNASHQIKVPGGRPKRAPDGKGWENLTSMEIQWMNYHLKGEGKPFPKCEFTGENVREGQSVKVCVKVKSPAELKAAAIYYSYNERPWRNRYWKKVEAKDEQNGVYSALIPVNEPELPITCFAVISDTRNITVSTTTKEIQAWKLGFKPEDRVESLFKEDFESADVRSKWGKPFAYREKTGNYSLSLGHARSGKMGLKINGKLVFRSDSIRGEAMKKSGAKGLSLWARSKGETGFDVALMAEDENGQRYYWYTPVENPGTEWKKIELTWDKFKYAGKTGGTKFDPKSIKKQLKPAPIPMISKHLAQIRLITPENAELTFDDIETIK